jgi:hypothetical protein
MQRWVLDVSMAWAPVAAGAAARLAARGREQYKDGAYKVAMRRVRAQHKAGVVKAQTGWLDDRFVPLGYEVGGAWGPSAVNAFQEVLAVKAATTNRELTDFSIINFASHWQQAIGVSIVRGAASVVARAAPMGADGEAEGEVEETEASQEHNPDAR